MKIGLPISTLSYKVLCMPLGDGEVSAAEWFGAIGSSAIAGARRAYRYERPGQVEGLELESKD